MGIEITLIGNDKLQQAAMTADSKGKNANNGKLDKNELKIFRQEAENMGCNTDETEFVCNNVKEEAKLDRRNDRGTSWKAYGVSVAVSAGITGAQKVCQRMLPFWSRRLSETEINTVNQAADGILKHPKLGIARIIDAGRAKLITLSGNSSTQKAVEKGHNALCVQILGGGNVVYVNREKLSLATFHELGHAHNCNNSAFLKGIQRARSPLMGIAGMFAFIPAITKEIKPEEGKELTFRQKFHNGFRKACPALATMISLPVFAEESIATIKGNAWAKQLLEPALHRKVVKTNAIGLITYAIMAIGLGLAGYAALKMKDKSVNQYEAQKPELVKQLMQQ